MGCPRGPWQSSSPKGNLRACHPGVGAGPGPLSCHRPTGTFPRALLRAWGLYICPAGARRGRGALLTGDGESTPTAGAITKIIHARSHGERGLTSGGPRRGGDTSAPGARPRPAQQERGDEATPCILLASSLARASPGETAPAAGHYRQALALADALGMRPLQAHCHRGLGRLYAAMGRRRRPARRWPLPSQCTTTWT